MNIVIVVGFIVVSILDLLQFINCNKLNNSTLYSFLSLNIVYYSFIIFLLVYKCIIVSLISNIILILFNILYLSDIKKEKYSFITTIFLIINIISFLYLLIRYFI